MSHLVDAYVDKSELLPPIYKNDILDTLTVLDLPKNQYFLIGGANMVLRGIKKYTTDIDMLVSDEVFSYLAEQKGAEVHEPPELAKLRGAINTTIWVANNQMRAPISATHSLGDGYYPMSFESHRDKVELIEDTPCLLAEYVKTAKEALQRKKDIVDLGHFAVYLGTPLVLPKPTISFADDYIS